MQGLWWKSEAVWGEEPGVGLGGTGFWWEGGGCVCGVRRG